MKLLVCGGWDFQDHQTLYDTLDETHATTPITLVIHGDRQGAEFLAYRWACRNKVPHLCQPDHGDIQKRNTTILKWQPDCIYAFPGGKETKDMIKRGLKAGIETFEIEV